MDVVKKLQKPPEKPITAEGEGISKAMMVFAKRNSGTRLRNSIEWNRMRRSYFHSIAAKLISNTREALGAPKDAPMIICIGDPQNLDGQALELFEELVRIANSDPTVTVVKMGEMYTSQFCPFCEAPLYYCEQHNYRVQRR